MGKRCCRAFSTADYQFRKESRELLNPLPAGSFSNRRNTQVFEEFIQGCRSFLLKGRRAMVFLFPSGYFGPLWQLILAHPL